MSQTSLQAYVLHCNRNTSAIPANPVMVASNNRERIVLATANNNSLTASELAKMIDLQEDDHCAFLIISVPVASLFSQLVREYCVFGNFRPESSDNTVFKKFLEYLSIGSMPFVRCPSASCLYIHLSLFRLLMTSWKTHRSSSRKSAALLNSEASDQDSRQPCQ